MRFTLVSAIIAVVLPLLAATRPCEAQPTKAPRVGLVALGSAEPSPVFEALRRGLRERGWIEGQTITFEDRSMVDHYNSLPDVAAELVRLKLDVIVINGTTVALAVRKVTKTTPIVALTGADPVEMGLITSLARPGGNVTGVTTSGRDLVGKRLELLRETLPRLSRVGMLWNPESQTQPRALKNAEAAGKSLGLQLQPAEVRRPEDFEKAFAKMAEKRAEALLLAPSIPFQVHRARIVELAARHQLPSISQDRAFVHAGGMMSYGPDLKVVYARLANYVDQILKGAKPGELPFEQPTKFELIINMRTAKMLGVAIPPSLLARADEIIE